MTEHELCVRDEAHLADIAALAARHAYAGLFLALYGELGAGKTAFVRALGAALGEHEVKSPTFIILDEHATLLHVDAYRLSSAQELYDTGYLDYLGRKRITAMEWPEKVPEALPRERLDLYLTGSGEGPRGLRFVARGSRPQAMLKEMFPCC